MKPSTFCIWAAVLAITQVFAQDHIAPCSGSSDHSGGICYGCATGRAAGKFAGDAVCDPLTFYQSSINQGFFTFYGDTSLNGLQQGDLVSFAAHVVYVRSTGSPVGTSRVDQYSTLRLQEEPNLLLNNVKQEFGNWTGYYRRKAINVTVQNSFSGGDVTAKIKTARRRPAVIISPGW